MTAPVCHNLVAVDEAKPKMLDELGNEIGLLLSVPFAKFQMTGFMIEHLNSHAANIALRKSLMVRLQGYAYGLSRDHHGLCRRLSWAVCSKRSTNA